MQAPHLHHMLAQAAAALGINNTPELYVQNSSQAAIYYLQVPLRRFHGLAGTLAFQVTGNTSNPSLLVMQSMPSSVVPAV